MLNVQLLGPEIVLSGAALLVVLLDLVVRNKSILAGVGVLGVIGASVATVGLYSQQGTAMFGAVLVDPFSILFKLIFLGIAALVMVSSIDYVSRFKGYQGEYYALIMMSTVGLMLMASTGELISIYVSLELASISLYAMAGFLRNKKSSEAGLKYLLLGALSSAVLLYGMALLYGLTGSTDLTIIGLSLGSIGQTIGSPDQWAIILAMILVTAGFGFKIAAVPFQMWVPDVYEGAPTPVTAFLSVGSKAAGFAVILRFFYVAFGSASVDWASLFAILAVLTMTFGNVVALVQTNIKRMLGYSSVAQAGYLIIGLATITNQGVSGVIFFLLGYSLTNLGAFIAIIAITNKIGSDEIADFAGVSRRAPLLAFSLLFCMLSLAGIPPTVGFIAKLYLFSAAVGDGLVWLVAIGVINSAISVYYYWKVIKAMYLVAPADEERVSAGIPTGAALTLAVLGVLVIGLVPAPLLAAAQYAAQTLIPLN